MRCDDVAELLLAPELDSRVDVDAHVDACASCAHLARNVVRLDTVLRSTLVIEPPLDLQRQLANLVITSAQPRTAPWWNRLFPGQLNFDWLVFRPNVVVTQGLAAVMVALASWQIFGWLSAFRPVVGDVGYAMELVAASPAVIYLGGFQIDVQNLVLWSLVGGVGWLVSENGAIGKRVSALADRFRLP